jgi:tetratricopeptide (TPR) repeat protein
MSPSEASGAFRVGLSLRNRGQYDQAISEFEKALGDAKRGARAALMTGLCYRDQNRIKEAIESFKLGIHMPEVSENDLSELFYQLGRSYELLSDVKEALHFYNKSLGPDGRFRDSADRIAALSRR